MTDTVPALQTEYGEKVRVSGFITGFYEDLWLRELMHLGLGHHPCVVRV